MSSQTFSHKIFIGIKIKMFIGIKNFIGIKIKFKRIDNKALNTFSLIKLLLTYLNSQLNVWPEVYFPCGFFVVKNHSINVSGIPLNSTLLCKVSILMSVPKQPANG